MHYRSGGEDLDQVSSDIFGEFCSSVLGKWCLPVIIQIEGDQRVVAEHLFSQRLLKLFDIFDTSLCFLACGIPALILLDVVISE